MGHDISAYIKPKFESNDSSLPDNEAAFFRINAFNTKRQKLFYGILHGSDVANAGVSGNGSTIEFTREDIKTAISACKYYLDDEAAVDENFLQRIDEADSKTEIFVKVFKDLFPNSSSLFHEGDSNLDEIRDEIREDIVDIWKFHEDILSEYDDVKKTDETAGIQIYFG